MKKPDTSKPGNTTATIQIVDKDGGATIVDVPVVVKDRVPLTPLTPAKPFVKPVVTEKGDKEANKSRYTGFDADGKDSVETIHFKNLDKSSQKSLPKTGDVSHTPFIAVLISLGTSFIVFARNIFRREER